MPSFDVVSEVDKHELTNAVDQAKLVAFIESIDASTFPIPTISVSHVGTLVRVGFNSIAGVHYSLEAKDHLNDPWVGPADSGIGTGSFMQLAVPLDRPIRFLRLLATP